MKEQRQRTWNELIDDLKNDYTLSIKDVCKLLKASRGWVSKYILPHVDTIYLNSRIRDGKHMIGVDWVKMVAKKIGREMSESTWINKREFEDLIARSIVSITKQTKSVPVTVLMKPEMVDTYFAEFEDLLAAADAEGDINKKYVLWAAAQDVHYKYIDDRAAELLKHKCKLTERGKVERVPVDFPADATIADFVAPHDIKDYGDTDEEVFRGFFRDGYIRVELAVPDADGVVGSKVYYLPDPQTLKPLRSDEKIFVVSEAAWTEYLLGL